MKADFRDSPAVLAIAAHPDDIEFMMGGTLLMLARAGYRIHYINIANGNRGTKEYNSEQIIAIREAEAKQACEVLGAEFHPSFCNDLEVFYSTGLLERLVAVVREVCPRIVLTQSPGDYMEDHQNACRLAVSATFSRGMPNFVSVPRTEPFEDEVTLYHAMPYGLCDALGERVVPHAIADVSSCIDVKREALARHRSQQNWLEESQGNAYLDAMIEMSGQMGALSGRFKYGEGWRKHLHIGFCDPLADPLRDALGDKYMIKNFA